MQFFTKRPERVAALRIGDENREKLLGIQGVRRVGPDLYVVNGDVVPKGQYWLVLPEFSLVPLILSDEEFQVLYQPEERTG